jgi:hypothetical protein
MEKRDEKPNKKGTGESEGRRRGLEHSGGQPLTTPLEDGQKRGVDDEGRHTTGTHGGPKKDGSEANRP